MTTFLIVWALSLCQDSYYSSQEAPKCYGVPDKYINVSEIAQMDPFKHIYCKKWTGGTVDVEGTGFAKCGSGPGIGCQLTLKDKIVIKTFQACTAFKKLEM